MTEIKMDDLVDTHVNNCPWDKFMEPHTMICVHCSTVCYHRYETEEDCRLLCPLYALKPQATTPTTLEPLMDIDPTEATIYLRLIYVVTICIMIFLLALVILTWIIITRQSEQFCKRGIKDINWVTSNKSSSDPLISSESGKETNTKNEPEKSSAKSHVLRRCLKCFERRKREKPDTSPDDDLNQQLHVNDVDNQTPDSSSFDSGKGQSLDSNSLMNRTVTQEIQNYCLPNNNRVSRPSSSASGLSSEAKSAGDYARSVPNVSCQLEQVCSINYITESLGISSAESVTSPDNNMSWDERTIAALDRPLDSDGTSLSSSIAMEGDHCSKNDEQEALLVGGEFVANQEHNSIPSRRSAENDDSGNKDCKVLSNRPFEQLQSNRADSDIDILKSVQCSATSGVTPYDMLPVECSLEAEDLHQPKNEETLLLCANVVHEEIVCNASIATMICDSALRTSTGGSYKKDVPRWKNKEQSMDTSNHEFGVSIRETSPVTSCRSLEIQEREHSCDTIPKSSDSGYGSEQASSGPATSSLKSMDIQTVESNREVDLVKSAQYSMQSAINLTLHSDAGGHVVGESSPNRPVTGSASVAASTDAWPQVMKLYECIESQLFRFPWVVGCMISTDVMELVLNLANYQLNTDTAREELCQHIPQSLWEYLKVTEEGPGIVFCCATYGAGGRIHELDESDQRGKSASTTLIGLANDTSYAFTVGHLLKTGQACQVECNDKKTCDDRFVRGSCLENIDTVTTFKPKNGTQKNITHKLYDVSLVRMCRPIPQANGVSLRYKEDTPIHVVLDRATIDPRRSKKMEVLFAGSSDGLCSRGRVLRYAMYVDGQKFAINFLEICSTDKASPFHIEPGRSGSLITSLPDENHVAKALAYVLGHVDGDTSVVCAAPLWEAMDKVCTGFVDLLKHMTFHDFNPHESGFTSH